MMRTRFARFATVVRCSAASSVAAVPDIAATTSAIDSGNALEMRRLDSIDAFQRGPRFRHDRWPISWPIFEHTFALKNVTKSFLAIKTHSHFLFWPISKPILFVGDTSKSTDWPCIDAALCSDVPYSLR